MYHVTFCLLPVLLLLAGNSIAQTVPSDIKKQQSRLRQTADTWMQHARKTGAFTENKGQLKDQDGKANNAVKYLLNMPGLNIQLRQTGFSYDAWVLGRAFHG